MRQRDHRSLGALKDDPGVGRKTAGEMNAKVSRVFLEGAMDFFAILAVGEHPTPAQGGRSIQLAIIKEKPLIGVFGFYFLSAE
jgi:hypothetical protein